MEDERIIELFNRRDELAIDLPPVEAVADAIGRDVEGHDLLDEAVIPHRDNGAIVGTPDDDVGAFPHQLPDPAEELTRVLEMMEDERGKDEVE